MNSLNFNQLDEIALSFSFNHLKSNNKNLSFTSHLKVNTKTAVNESSLADNAHDCCPQRKKADSFLIMDMYSESFFP